MARYKYDWSDARLKRFLKEGRGQGEGKNYKSWLQVNDISGRGRVTRLQGHKSERIYHFLSDMEKNVFFLYEFESAVKEIREHFPLLDLLEIDGILDAKMKNRLIDKKTSLPLILTTTFFIRLEINGSEKFIARSVKMAKELDKSNVIELYHIQKRYWKAKNIDYGIITEKEIPKKYCKNLEWIHSSYDLSNWGFNREEVVDKSNLLIEKVNVGSLQLRKILEEYDCENQFDVGTGLLIFKHLLAHKKLSIDLKCEIDLNMPIAMVNINPKIEDGV